MIQRRVKLFLGAACLVAGVLVVGFGPLVRHEARRAADRFGAVVSIARVAPTLHGVRLLDVDVTLEDVPSVRVHIDEVDVAYGAGGRRIALRGGVVAAIGARDVVLRQAEAWRSHHVAPDTGGAAGPATSGGTELAGLRVSWADSAGNPTETLSAADLAVARVPGGFVVSAGEATVSLGQATVTVKGGRVELTHGPEGGYRIGGLAAMGVDAQLVLVVSKVAVAHSDGLATPVPVPPSPLPLAVPKHRSGKAGRAGVSPATASSTLTRPEGPGVAYRSQFIGAARMLDLALEPDAIVRLEGVRARVRRGDDVLNLGPGVLRITRAEGRVVVDLAPVLRPPPPSLPGSAPPGSGPAPGDSARSLDHEEALTFRLAVPLQDGAEEIALDVDGGPIWLSSLGVGDGDFGLFDVGRASLSTRSHLALTADGKTLRVDGQAKVHALSVKSGALSDEPVAGLELAVRLKGELELDGGRAHIAEGEVDLGAIRLTARGEYEQSGDVRRFRGDFEMPLTACQAMLDSTPKGLVPTLQGMRLAGSYGLRGHADIDTLALERGLALDWDVANTCRVIEAPPSVSIERFRAPFRRTAYDPEGRPVAVETGPGTPEWVPLTGISKFMETAVLTTEDGSFHRHHGFDHEAIRNSIRENLRRRRFVRGASTISMQLAKNLYLDRGKNLSRKLQEAVLTMYLEQELTKDQLLELYFNVVEFGPMIYGIGPAARYYFNASARELSLGQALYISSIMPNPKVQHFGAGGVVTPTWMSYLRKLMKLARARDNLSDEELDEGLRETVVRGAPAPQRGERAITGPEPELPPDAPEEWPY